MTLEVTASMVKELRDKTGAGMMDCKEALVKSEGDIKRAVEVLREKGIADAEKRTGRAASEGRVESYIHLDGKIGVLVEVNCETDFVAKNDLFIELVSDIAMQVAAMNPDYISRDDVPDEVIEEEKNILRRQALNNEKPEHVIEQIVEGRMDKFYSERCLLEQPFIKDEDKTIELVIKEVIAELGENINMRRFVRYQLGEGIEKEEKSLSEEVQEELNK